MSNGFGQQQGGFGQQQQQQQGFAPQQQQGGFAPQQAPAPQGGFTPQQPQQGFAPAQQMPQQAQQGYQQAPPMGGPPMGGGQQGAPVQLPAFNLQDQSMTYTDGPSGDSIPNGEYTFEVLAMEGAMSQAGKPKVNVRVKVLTPGPAQNAVTTISYPIENATQRLRGLLEAIFGEGNGWDRQTGIFADRLPHAAGRHFNAYLSNKPRRDGEGTWTDLSGHKPPTM